MENTTMRLMPVAGMAVAYCIATNAMATNYEAGSIAISSPWSRATPKGAQTAIGYMTIKNNGTTPDRLIGGSVDVADRFQLHAMTMEDGVAKMRDLSGIDIKPGQTIEFKPSGSHAMFVNLKRALSKGDHIKGTLTFERAGTVHIEYDVEGIGAQSSPSDMKQMQH
jgi:periplasmic copper chaperone A